MTAIPEGHYIELANGYRVHYHDIGQGDPVIFLHGSGPGASAWSNFKQNKDYFAGQGYRVILPDTLGYGLSSKPEEATYSLDFMLSGIEALVVHLKLQRVHLVGNSLGGIMAIAFAVKYPEWVEKLILLAPGGLTDKSRYLSMPGIQAMVDCLLGDEGPTKAKIKNTFEKQLFDSGDLSDELLEERREIALTQPKSVFTKMQVPVIADRLGSVICPTLIFWGVNDQFCPVETHPILLNGIRDSRAIIFNRCGHWVQVEYPELFNQYSIGFFREQPW